ncbi:MAG: hypothetical protein ACXV2I_04195 [Actinomycetes bacterium]
MTAPSTLTAELRELHDDYAWEVNAAVARNEDRVVERLSGEFTERALRLISERFRHAS